MKLKKISICCLIAITLLGILFYIIFKDNKNIEINEEKYTIFTNDINLNYKYDGYIYFLYDTTKLIKHNEDTTYVGLFYIEENNYNMNSSTNELYLLKEYDFTDINDIVNKNTASFYKDKLYIQTAGQNGGFYEQKLNGESKKINLIYNNNDDIGTDFSIIDFDTEYIYIKNYSFFSENPPSAKCDLKKFTCIRIE